MILDLPTDVLVRVFDFFENLQDALSLERTATSLKAAFDASFCSSPAVKTEGELRSAVEAARAGTRISIEGPLLIANDIVAKESVLIRGHDRDAQLLLAPDARLIIHSLSCELRDLQIVRSGYERRDADAAVHISGRTHAQLVRVGIAYSHKGVSVHGTAVRLSMGALCSLRDCRLATPGACVVASSARLDVSGSTFVSRRNSPPIQAFRGMVRFGENNCFLNRDPQFRCGTVLVTAC